MRPFGRCPVYPVTEFELDVGLCYVGRLEMNDEIDDILKGSFDLHVHAGPDASQERRLDAMDTAREAYQAEMSGFVLKSHEYPTAPLAQALNRMYPGLGVAGSVALNRSAGGLNPDAVSVSAGLGARVVWMPTFDADFYLRSQGHGPGIRLIDDSERLVRAVMDILDILAEYDMVLASGHVSPVEAIALFKAAKEQGVRRIIATHPGGIATDEEQREMASLGAYLEYTFLACMPNVAKTTVGELVASVRTFGLDRCVVTTGFGQWMNPPAAEGMRMAIASLLRVGMAADEVSTLVKANPLELIGDIRPS